MTITPADTYNRIMTAYAGATLQVDQDEIWAEFCRSIGITDPAAIAAAKNNAAYQTQFLTYMEKGYVAEATLPNLSPEEVAKREIMNLVFALSLDMMKTLQNSLAVTAKQLVFNSKWQQEYTNMMTRIPVYTAKPTQTMIVPKDATGAVAVDKITFGACNISLADIAAYLATAPEATTDHKEFTMTSAPFTLVKVETNPGVGYGMTQLAVVTTTLKFTVTKASDGKAVLQVSASLQKATNPGDEWAPGYDGAWENWNDVITTSFGSASSTSTVNYGQTMDATAVATALKQSFGTFMGSSMEEITGSGGSWTFKPTTITTTSTGITLKFPTGSGGTTESPIWYGILSDEAENYLRARSIDDGWDILDMYIYECDPPYNTVSGLGLDAATSIQKTTPFIRWPYSENIAVTSTGTERYFDVSYPSDNPFSKQLEQYRSESNSKLQQYIEGVRSRRQAIRDQTTGIQTLLTQAKEAMSEQSNLLTSLLESMKTLIGAIFR